MAFIGEPIQQAFGACAPPREYWPIVREICDRYGILLIVDEVISGFGRTGTWFASQHFGIRPDMMTMAKGISSGYVPDGGPWGHGRRRADPWSSSPTCRPT